MGGSGMSDAELKQIVTDWRTASPHIVQLWWDVENAAIKAVRDKTETETHGIHFSYESGFLFIRLLSGRLLAYVKPRIGENRFGGDSITYEALARAKSGNAWKLTPASWSKTLFRRPHGTCCSIPCKRYHNPSLSVTFTMNDHRMPERYKAG